MKRITIPILLALALTASGALANNANIQLTPIGSPTWEPTDVHIFTAGIGIPPSFFSFQLVVEGILPPPYWVADTQLTIRPGAALAPPYTNLIANGLSAYPLREDTVFTPAEFSNGQAVWVGWMQVPSTSATTGSSPDYANGPIIPNSLCPITQTGITTRNGTIFDTAWNGATPALTDLNPPINVDGWSRMPQFNAEAQELGSSAAAQQSVTPRLVIGDGSATGFYHEEFTELDATSNGWIVAADFQVSDHDLAITSIKAPKTIALSSTKLSQTKFVTVTIQNRGVNAETITNLDGLVTLEVHSLSNNCPDLTPTLLAGPPQKTLPVTLKPKGNLKVVFSITYSTGCVPDPAKSAKGALHNDYRYTATANAAGIDGLADIRTSNDDCPRAGSGTDKGCGGKTATGTLGADVFTDVVMK